MRKKHIKGPLHANGPYVLKGEDCIAALDCDSRYDDDAEATAILFAAAPDLLEALKMVLPENNMRDGKIAYPGFEICEIARAAIAKAEGRS